MDYYILSSWAPSSVFCVNYWLFSGWHLFAEGLVGMSYDVKILFCFWRCLTSISCFFPVIIKFPRAVSSIGIISLFLSSAFPRLHLLFCSPPKSFIFQFLSGCGLINQVCYQHFPPRIGIYLSEGDFVDFCTPRLLAPFSFWYILSIISNPEWGPFCWIGAFMSLFSHNFWSS